MKYICIIALSLCAHFLAAQQIGSISCASKSNHAPFSVGEIYVAGNLSGYVGIFSFLVGNDLLTTSVDIDIADDFSIIPNPTNGRFEIKTAGSSINNIQVIDASGSVIKSFQNDVQGDISDLSPGLYFLKINYKNTFKIIKN
ncbi:MAG: T9SS type A sorting domain-containing protein [Saprospiraceae bacterium]|nr:T9SS type A sorting domain-containing protein [Saprospiraceae bacterium]